MLTNDLRAAAIYAIMTSPNDVSSTTHEASVSVAYGAKQGLGVLTPTFAVTVRPEGTHGVYTLAGIEPSLPLGLARRRRA